mmetsp:Transcript_6993/g.15063  ORF Transcript_6993/g.15063 Transcript_6993/m.15063 type:complete len:213 (-) Transcript_6993:169-807(-)
MPPAEATGRSSRGGDGERNGESRREGRERGIVPRALDRALQDTVGSSRQDNVRRPGPYDRPGLGKGGYGIGKGGVITTGSTFPSSRAPPVKTLDRSKTCPFLLRVFHKIGGHHGLEAFAVRGKEPVDDELQVYTWPDVTLRELADLVRDVAPEARSPSAKLNFRLIYPDKGGRNVMTELGTVASSKRGPDDEKPLSASKFQTGDLLDLAIHP